MNLSTKSTVPKSPMVAIFPFCQIPFMSWLTLVLPDHTSINPPQADLSQKYTRQIYCNGNNSLKQQYWHAVEPLQVAWLIANFNQWFAHLDTVLVNGIKIGKREPEYFAHSIDTHGKVQPAKIVFAHGFFSSGLHEISHWCIAGKKRRERDDFGYWYAPDGRSEQEQKHFEQVEIKPQAIECLLTLSCGKAFKVSQDNLHANFDTSQSTFVHDVCEQAIKFWQTGEKLPTDAKTLLSNLQMLRPYPLTQREIYQNFGGS